MLLGVWAVAFLLRLLNTQGLLADPLFYNPLGGNVVYLQMGEEIAGGALVPEGAFTANSPLYPYILAGIYKLFGIGSLYAVRLVGAAFDAGTCAVLGLLAYRHFGTAAGWGAGLTMAVYGPAIFFAAELAPVPFTLFLLSLGILLLDGQGQWKGFLLAGLVLGLATGTRPNLLLAGLLALLVPWARQMVKARQLSGAVAVGLVLGIAPVTMLNVAASGRFTLLTLSAGHNLYIGHNPAAEPQYALPAAFDGDIFVTMKALAEEVEVREFGPEEVSGYYTRLAVSHVLSNPGREAALTGRRALLLFNDFEATTYANIDYQRWYSPILDWAPTFAWLLALALPGVILLWNRGRLHFWIPLIVAAISVLGFFYIARLRVIMIPTLVLMSGATVAKIVDLAGSRRWRAIALPAVLAFAGFGFAKLPLLGSDPSNDWNKAGGVLRVLERFDEAEAALLQARAANPENPNTYMNLSVLYRETGRTEEAAAAEDMAREILSGGDEERVGFVQALQEIRR
jgi:tetratricopeptide (TPR) repeat protein